MFLVSVGLDSGLVLGFGFGFYGVVTCGCVGWLIVIGTRCGALFDVGCLFRI